MTHPVVEPASAFPAGGVVRREHPGVYYKDETDRPILNITGGWPVAYQRTRITIAFSLLTLAGGASVSSAQATATHAVSARRDHTEADVQFMQGMIGHHAQAIVMSAMAPTHGASAQLALFARKV